MEKTSPRLALLTAAQNDLNFDSSFALDILSHEEFPAFVKALPRADYGTDAKEGIVGYVLQGKKHQLVFNENKEPITFATHRHAQSFGIVLRGTCKLYIAGTETTYHIGQTYHVPGGVEHYAWQSADYRDVVLFNQPDRVRALETELSVPQKQRSSR